MHPSGLKSCCGTVTAVYFPSFLLWTGISLTVILSPSHHWMLGVLEQITCLFSSQIVGSRETAPEELHPRSLIRIWTWFMRKWTSSLMPWLDDFGGLGRGWVCFACGRYMNYCGQRADHSRLFAEMATITPPILVCISFCNVIAFPLIKRWHLFSHPLSLSWPCGLLIPLECGKSGVV